MTIGVAIVGCGLIGRKRAANLPAGTSLIACYDTDFARARDLSATATGEPAVAPTLHALLDRDDVALVLVATTHDTLCGVAAAAVDRGRHVLVEKPGAHRLEDLVSLRDRARERGTLVRVGYNHRFHPALRRARELVSSDQYGPLLWLRARYGHGGRVGYEQEWRADPALSGGGELIDQGSHLIDLVRSMFGDVDLAFADLRTAFWDMPVEDNAFLAVTPRSGGFAWLHASWTEWKNLFSLEITLQTAKIEVSGLGGSYGPESLTLYEMQPEMGPPVATSWQYPTSDASWRDELADVVVAIGGGPAIGASIDDAIATMTVIGRAYDA